MKEMLFEVLLAKSSDEVSKGEPIPTYARLVPHLRAVEKAGEAIVEAIGPLILEQLDLPSEPWLSRLHRGLKVACLCHDIGKANVAFQRMVRGKLSPAQQPARHELLSAVLLADKNSQVRTWALNLLSENGKHSDAAELLELLHCVIAAVGGHHVKLDGDWKKASIALREGGCGTEIEMLLTHPDLQRLFGSAVKAARTFDLTGNKEDFLGDLLLPFKLNSNRWKDKLQNEPRWWRFAAVLKALTTAADVAGSALLPNRISPAMWVQMNLARSQRVTSEQMHEVVVARLRGKTHRPFQQAVSASKERVTLVEAGCGTGKTAAAYMWAATHAEGRKLFFCYPTTGTATEGFLGYVHETAVEATLMHSRAIVDLENVTKVKQDEEEGDHMLRIESLRAWSPQVVVWGIRLRRDT
jgi:CRISPR-associated endonuclease/helicase Cas3